MAEILLAIISVLMGVNMTATFKILYELGGLKETVKTTKATVERLQSRVTQLERERSHHELA